MGKSFSPVLADLFMGNWEEGLAMSADAFGGEVGLYHRYADDSILLFKGSDEALKNWINHLNSRNPAIKITVETEEANTLPFPDLSIRRTNTGFTTTVYRKPQNTDQVPPPTSFTEPRYLRSAVHSDALRAKRYCSTRELLNKELNHIRAKYKRHGYKRNTVERAINDALHPNPSPKPDLEPIRVSIPYTGPTFHQLKKEAARIGLQLVSKPARTIGSALCSRQKHSLPQHQKTHVVYSIQCDCGGRYVGETRQELQQRIKDHIIGWVKGDASSAFGAHHNHHPHFDEATILDSEPHPTKRLLRESSWIRTFGERETILVAPNDRNINRNSGTLMDARWLPLLQVATGH